MATQSNLPTIGELASLLKSLKADIDDECRAVEDDSIPGMLVTIGWSAKTGNWSYQTGDNSFTGGAYGYPTWAVVYLYRRSNCRDLAREAIDELAENAPE